MKINFELNLDYTNMMVWADVLQAFGNVAQKYPELVQQVTEAFDEAMDEALSKRVKVTTDETEDDSE